MKYKIIQPVIVGLVMYLIWVGARLIIGFENTVLLSIASVFAINTYNNNK